MDLNVYLMQTK